MILHQIMDSSVTHLHKRNLTFILQRTFDRLHLSLNTLSSFEFETVLVMFRCPTFTIINVTLLIVEHLKT